MTEDELLARHPASHSVGEPIFSRAVAREVVEDAAAQGFVILGMDGVRLEPHAVRPDLSAILDYSAVLRHPWPEAVRRSRDAALRFLDDQTQDLYFCVVLAEP